VVGRQKRRDASQECVPALSTNLNDPDVQNVQAYQRKQFRLIEQQGTSIADGICPPENLHSCLKFLNLSKSNACAGDVVQNYHPAKRGTKMAAIHIVAFFLSGCGGDDPAWPDAVLKELCITIDKTNILPFNWVRKDNFFALLEASERFCDSVKTRLPQRHTQQTQESTEVTPLGLYE
jgi:hypothetical protein